MLREDVDGGLRGFVGGFEGCAEVIEAAPEARVVGAIHCGASSSVAERATTVAAAVVVVVEAVVGPGGMRAGARADEVKPPTSMQASGW